MANQHEPTMEEILASIRKIISEDAAPGGETRNDAEVLDLTQEVHEVHDGHAGCAPPAETQGNSAHHEPTEVVPATAQANEGLFSDDARAAADRAMSAMRFPEPEEDRTTAAPAGESVEAAFERAVREAFEPVLESWLAENRETLVQHMKPVIRAWLDEHFPPLLENALKSELARAARTRNRH